MCLVFIYVLIPLIVSRKECAMGGCVGLWHDNLSIGMTKGHGREEWL